MIRAVTLLTLATLAAIAQPAPTFDVASVKALPTELKPSGRENIDAQPGTLTMRGVSLKSCLVWAYGVHDYQIAGPGWLASERYDILAKAPGATADQIKLMLQSLLADRFRMKLRHESRDLPVYVLLPAKSGLKLNRAASSDAPAQKFNGGTVILTNYTTQELADRIGTAIFGLGRTVIDRTGAEGHYDFEIEMAGSIQEMKMNAERNMGDPDPTPVAKALQRVGIKLDAQKGPLDMLVVDSASKTPTDN